MRKGKSDELRSECNRKDLGKGIRGEHLKSYRAGTNLVLLRPEVAAVFPTDQAVNKALSALIEVVKYVGAAVRPNRHTG